MDKTSIDYSKKQFHYNDTFTFSGLFYFANTTVSTINGLWLFAVPYGAVFDDIEAGDKVLISGSTQTGNDRMYTVSTKSISNHTSGAIVFLEFSESPGTLGGVTEVTLSIKLYKQKSVAPISRDTEVLTYGNHDISKDTDVQTYGNHKLSKDTITDYANK